MRRLGVAVGVLGAALGVAAGLFPLLSGWTAQAQPGRALAPLPVHLDSRGPYLVLATRAAAADYQPAIRVARKLHPDAAYSTFDPVDLAAAQQLLRSRRPGMR